MTRNNLKGEGLIWANALKVPSIMAGKAYEQDHAVAGNVVSAMRKQRDG